MGTDATSGISSCAPAVTYQGPDAPQTALSGTCTDKAANTSSATAELRYDTNPPVLGRLRTELRNGGIVLRWTASKDASSFAVVRQPGLNGSKPSTIYSGAAYRFVDRNLKEDVRYRYTVSAYDEAGNAAVKGLRLRSNVTTTPASTSASGRPALAKPPNGARLASPPLLDWTAVPEASYYNVQLFRDGKKILTAWPGSTSFRLGQTWKFDGRTQRLSPGRYRWYVWPGFGPRSASRYGKLLGTRTFVVTR